MSAETLGEGLVRCGGPAFSLRKTTRRFIQLCRASRRATGAARPLRSRRALDQLLQRPHNAEDAALSALADGLRAAARNHEDSPPEATLDEIEQGLQRAGARIRATPIQVSVQGWPPGMTEGVRARILGHPPGTALPPAEVALVVHRLHGLAIGGHHLRVEPALLPGEVLPAVPRDRRGDRGRRGRGAPWLRHLDEEGTRSLTPEPLARVHARLLAQRHPSSAPPRHETRAEPLADKRGPVRIVEPCCGCGGNTVAFAQGGAVVEAWELDPARAALARANLRETGVSDRVRVRVGDGLAAARTSPADAIFIDPPWELSLSGGRRRRLESWGALCQALPGLDAALAAHPVALLKLPRTFAVDTLPGGAAAWSLRYELGSAGTGDAQVVRMITALRPPR
jgi:hypothetical protein